MSSLKPIPLTFKQKLSESEFGKFRKVNRIYFFILTLLALLMATSLFVSIKIGFDTSMATGLFALFYTIIVSICSAKNERIVFLWIVGSLFTAPLAFIPIHIRLALIGKKNEWL